ncbi:hypothetical protein B0H17DRAFT_1146993 [Mycena rosella]|uniref:Uncharacterized protein n=1 Tax=Mycena rosella TaxID=1033263 RepID=A0AAD7CMN8_MYCRO|nr:hypothetical protein B0H17DRAFT_1146993 [Mycena rosella]
MCNLVGAAGGSCVQGILNFYLLLCLNRVEGKMNAKKEVRRPGGEMHHACSLYDNTSKEAGGPGSNPGWVMHLVHLRLFIYRTASINCKLHVKAGVPGSSPGWVMLVSPIFTSALPELPKKKVKSMLRGSLGNRSPRFESGWVMFRTHRTLFICWTVLKWGVKSVLRESTLLEFPKNIAYNWDTERQEDPVVKHIMPATCIWATLWVQQEDSQQLLHTISAKEFSIFEAGVPDSNPGWVIMLSRDFFTGVPPELPKKAQCKISAKREGGKPGGEMNHTCSLYGNPIREAGVPGSNPGQAMLW